MSRTDQLIKAAIRALNQNRALLDAMPDSLSGVQLDIKIGRDALPMSVHFAPRWGQSLALQSCGIPMDVGGYDFTT